MAIDLNTIPEEEAEQCLHDLNAKAPGELADEVHVMQEEAQPHLLQEDEQVVVHGTDLNVDASELQQPNEDMMECMQNSGADAETHVAFHEDEKIAMHVIDLNIDPTDLRQPHEDMMEYIQKPGANAETDVAFHEGEQIAMHGIDLNIDPVYLQQPNEDMMEYMQDYGVDAGTANIEFHEDELADSNFEHDHANEKFSHQSRNLIETERQKIYAALLERSKHGRLKRNTTTIVAEMLQVSRYQVQRVWRRVKECRAQGRPVDVSSRKPKNCGRKKIQADLSEVLSVPLHRRTTIRSLGEAIGVTKSTLHRWFKQGQLRRHSNTLKPLLTEENKKERLRWCISMLDERTFPTEPKFIEMENIIHLDEKWYYTTKKDRTYYLLPGEEEPYKTVQNKNSIGKVMFLTAVARPRYDDKGNCTFDGKIGVWAFIIKEPAKRRSRNRGRGTLVTKSIKVDRDIMRSYMIAKVLPAIVARWPREDAGKTIWIQQDNAPSHVLVHDEQFAAAVAQTGLDIRIINQPPNFPDINVLDLGFFTSLQPIADGAISRNTDELIENVQKAFNEYDPSKLNRTFLTLQECLIEVMKDGGGNRYKILHMNKGRLEALEMLPNSLSVDRRLYENVMESLQN